MFNENYAIDNVKFLDLQKDIQRFANYIFAHKIIEPQIYLSNTKNFIIAFFGCLFCNNKPHILPNNIFSNENFIINDENFNTLFLDEIHESLVLNKDSNFTLKTSGSTGKSKDIIKTYEKLFIEAQTLKNMFNEDDYFISSISHQHMYGLSYKVFLPLVCGGKVSSVDCNRPEIFFDCDLNNKTFITSPVILKAIVQHKKANEIKKLKTIISAGSKLEDSLRKQLNELTNARIIDVYGSTETGTIALNLGNGLTTLNEVNAYLNEQNEFCIKSPWCEYFISNDRVEIDEKKIKTLGRKDRIVKLNDQRLSLDMLDCKIKEHDFIKDAISIVFDDDNKVSMLLVLSDIGKLEFRNNGKKKIANEVKNFIKPFFKNCVRSFKVVDFIPYNAQSKVTKSDFLNKFNELKRPKWIKDNNLFISTMHEADFYFNDHFMDFPLVPGFIQIEFIEEVAKTIGINIANSKKIEQVKFSSFLKPDDIAKISLEVKNEKLYFTIYANDKICCNGRIWI